VDADRVRADWVAVFMLLLFDKPWTNGEPLPRFLVGGSSE
jgi:hypothetical protein